MFYEYCEFVHTTPPPTHYTAFLSSQAMCAHINPANGTAQPNKIQLALIITHL